jgi:hypothetical protein
MPGVLLAACFPLLGIAQSIPVAIPESTYAPLVMEEGTWDADVTFYQLGLAKPNAHPLVMIVFTKRRAPTPAK